MLSYQYGVLSGGPMGPLSLGRGISKLQISSSPVASRQVYGNRMLYQFVRSHFGV